MCICFGLLSLIWISYFKPYTLIYVYCDNDGVCDYLNKLKEPRYSRLSEILNDSLFSANLMVKAIKISRNEEVIQICDDFSKHKLNPHISFDKTFIFDNKRKKQYHRVIPNFRKLISLLHLQHKEFVALSKYKPHSKYSVKQLR